MSISVSPPQLATSLTSTDDMAPPNLDGLRSLLKEWNEQGINSKKGGDSTLKEQKLTKDESETAMASMYSQYQKMATQEDKDLVNMWTETLNILLTFAGLLSAIITAFLLTSQPDLHPPSNSSTDKILLYIARQFDNTTTTHPSPEEEVDQASPIRALAFWHASLGCSLLSAFGSLLSKQWVLHYQSSPIWVKTVQDQCHLREIRAYGISKWRMYAIIDSLPVLLQLSVFLFYIGLAETVHSTSTLLIITATFGGIMATLYAFTLIVGAFSPSCPSKSPITSLSYKVAGFAVVLCTQLFWTISDIVAAIRPSASDRPAWRTILRGEIDRWRAVGSFWQRSFIRSDERNLIEEFYGVAGVAFWWLQESELDEVSREAKVKAVIEVAESLPVDTVLSMNTWRGGFGDWCLQVFQAVGNEMPSRLSLLEADAVCHLMNKSPKTIQAVQNGVIKKDGRHYFAGPMLYGFVRANLRRDWTANSWAPLPVLEMPRSTFAVYLRFQLQDYIYPMKPDNGSNRKLLLQELPFALKPDYFLDMDQHIDSVIDAVSLAAIVLVPEHAPSQVKPMQGLVDSKLPERLLQALHRLSCYPHDQLPHHLVPVAVAAAARALQSIEDTKGLYESASWKTGEFADSLYRLLRLGRVWWNLRVEEDSPNCGSCLLYEMHLLMDISTPRYAEAYLGGHLKVLPLSPDSLGEILATYAHPTAPKDRLLEHRTEATGLLDLTLSPPYLVLPLPNPPRLDWSRTPSFTHSLDGWPQVIRQLIHDIGTAPVDSRLRLASLSVIIKGRDMLLPVTVSSLFPDLASDIHRLAEEMPQTNELTYELSRGLHDTFDRWPELLDALGELQRVLGHPRYREPATLIETTMGERVSPTLALEGLVTTLRDSPDIHAASESQSFTDS